jgi:secondary thiamine-phosphate synthase enzyme
VIQETIEISTAGRGTYDVGAAVAAVVRQSGIERGLCHLFLHHTSASIILCENADPLVRKDLEAFFSRLVPDGDAMFEHVDEGPDDMPAHVRSILTQNSMSVPIAGGKLALGTWQGIYVWEHRHRPHSRKLTVTVLD